MKKTAIVTGANKGLGLSVAQHLIQNNYKVVLACREKSKGQKAVEFLGENAKLLELDLSSLKSIPEKKGGILERRTTKAEIINK